ncbi:helix-turn-helix transcriptional regulator [Hymenobacter sp. UYCo722]|uniref:helix-turn-helix domain-containing protein n=1 Tax=Hymenobacter sp. UYCo722 TaxID=3156335 RepID=UPI0033944669
MTTSVLFGVVLRNYRLAAGISQEQLAFKAELHRTYIGSIERGERNISLLNIIGICKALNIKPSDFFQNFDDSFHDIILR